MDLLSLSARLPEVSVGAEDVLVREDDEGGGVWILVEGALRVRKGSTEVNTIAQPGAIVGEISVLLGAPAGATVEAMVPSRLRYAADGVAFLQSEPEVMRQIAIGLAERLNYVTTYMADLKHQYGDTPGLSMVDDVLRTLASRQTASARPGSARDPDPEY